jgi:U3 small nucleolar RNA-associated protein 12
VGDAANPLLVAYGVATPADYLLRILNRITSAELEESLLVLPFAYVAKLLPYLDGWIEKGLQVERCIRCLHLLFRIHMHQIVSNQVLIPILDSLRRKVLPGISVVKDQIGFNIAGLRFLHGARFSTETHTR